MEPASVVDTIAAIATPPGEGGISVVRLSGPQSRMLAARGFEGKRPLTEAASHTAHFGIFRDRNGEVIDEVVATVFVGPHSYTGEDIVEISCHGGMYVTRRILQALLDSGARHAQPGEFTKRAFLNGRIDLSQAEAVADLIHAKSERSHRASLRQLAGELSRRIEELRGGLIETTGLLELELDFVEDGFEFTDKERVRNQTARAIGQIDALLATFKAGRYYREGVKVVIAGMPNVGKSSLLNALLGENRAIVTDIPGTTRDTIEETVILEGLAFRIVDTAGLRETIDRVEKEGVRRSQEQVKSSDLVLLVMDVSRPMGEAEIQLAERLMRDLAEQSTPAILVLNKTDLLDRQNGDTSSWVEKLKPQETVKVSALKRTGLETLEKALLKAALQPGMHVDERDVTVTNARHYDALKRAQASLLLALESLNKGQSGEFVAVDLRAALESLGEITGTVTTDDILNAIFSKFCIGK